MIHAPGTFNKEKRTTGQGESATPGPAYYNPKTAEASPGAYIPRSRRQYLIDEKEAAKSPGPHDYQPKYHFIVKK